MTKYIFPQNANALKSVINCKRAQNIVVPYALIIQHILTAKPNVSTLGLILLTIVYEMAIAKKLVTKDASSICQVTIRMQLIPNTLKVVRFEKESINA